MHLDAFQRIVVDPGSLSVVRYTPHRAFVVTMNSSSGSLAHLGGQAPQATPHALRRRGRRGRRRSRGGTASPSTRLAAMPVIHRFDPPERFVPGTVGEPGQRTFFLQARAGAQVTSVALEKQQVQILGERVAELLDELIQTDGRRRRRSRR